MVKSVSGKGYRKNLAKGNCFLHNFIIFYNIA